MSQELSNDPQDHNFNWVKALEEQSVLNEFPRLESYVKGIVSEYMRTAGEQPRYKLVILKPPKESKAMIFHVALLERGFAAIGQDYGERNRVVFNVNPENEIIVTGPDDYVMLRATLALNEQYELRYTVGNESLLRWQVVVKVLKPLVVGHKLSPELLKLMEKVRNDQ